MTLHLLSTKEVKLNPGLLRQKAAFNQKRALFTNKMDLILRKKPVKCYIWSIALCGAETGMLLAVDQKHLESFETWCWRRMLKIIWTDHVRNEEVLLRLKEQRNIMHEISKRKANWIGHILRRNCLLRQVVDQHHDPATLPTGMTPCALYGRLRVSQGRCVQLREISPVTGFDLRTYNAI
jgi:hypothetical protein